MKLDFSQTASIMVKDPIHADICDCLNDALHQECGMRYECSPTDGGCFMKPIFGFALRRNSFVPEIAVSVSQDGEKTVMHLTGRPVKSVRRFVWFYIFFALLLEVFVLAAAVFSEVDNTAVALFIPIFMCIFGYLLCEIGTKVTFRVVVNAIKKVLQ